MREATDSMYMWVAVNNASVTWQSLMAGEVWEAGAPQTVTKAYLWVMADGNEMVKQWV